MCIITGGLAALPLAGRDLQQDFGYYVLEDGGHSLHLLPLRKTFYMVSALYSTAYFLYLSSNHLLATKPLIIKKKKKKK